MTVMTPQPPPCSQPETMLTDAMRLVQESRIYDAIDQFEALLTAYPDYVRGHVQLGLLYYQLCVTSKGREQMALALACRPTPAERLLIEQTLREQKALDSKRYYRPDFEALRRQSACHTPSVPR